jgi:ADP-heptose:LPS heptosyltransferase
VLRGNPNVDDVFVYNRSSDSKVHELTTLLWKLRGRRYESSITYCTDFDYKTGLFALLCGIRHRIGPSVRTHGVFYNDRVEMREEQHFIERNFELARRAGVEDFEDDTPRFYLDEDERDRAQKFFEATGLGSSGRVIGVHPGGGPWRKCRRWPRKDYVQLLRTLAAREDLEVVLMGGPDERDLTEGIAEEIPNRVVRAIELAGLGEFGALVERCNLFVGNDGGPVQIAYAVRTPTITIAGPTFPAAFAPRGGDHRVVETKLSLSCRPCIDYYDYASDGCPERTCLRSIAVTEVMEAINRQLGEANRG